MKLRTVLTALIALTIAIPATTSAEPPAQVPIQAYLTDSEGVPISSQTNVTVEIYSTETGGTALHTEQFQTTPEAGSFTAYLGTNETLDLSIFKDNQNLWAQITVGGETLQPRLKIATAPYAASASFAQDAGQLAGKSPSEYSYSAGNGLSLNNNTFSIDDTEVQSRISNQCSGGEFAVGVQQDGTLICQTASSTQAGSGLVKNSNTMSIDPTYTQRRVSGTCGSGEYIRAVNQDGTVQCGTDQGSSNAITTINTDSSLSRSRSGDTVDLAVAQDGIDATMLKSGAVDSTAIANGTIQSEDVATNTLSQGDIGSGAIGSSELQTNSVGASEIDTGAVRSDEIQDGSITADDIGEYGCDSSTNFQPVASCSLFSSTSNLPECDEVAVGGICEATSTNCGGAISTLEDNCGVDDVFIRLSP